MLGTQKTFKMEYENPICRAREKDASVGEKRLGEEMATSLRYDKAKVKRQRLLACLLACARASVRQLRVPHERC